MTLIFVVILFALVFEYINGFHDTANSIATVVATKVLTPRQAVVMAACTNLVGALMGTLMAANVWVRIIPGQRDMVAALQEGREPDFARGARAKLRSKHNTFMVIPVVLTMIGSHFPTTTYGAENPVRALAILILVGFGAAAIIRQR